LRIGEITCGVDPKYAGFAALIDLEDDTEGRIDRGDAKRFMQACGRLVPWMREQDIERDPGTGIEPDDGAMIMMSNFGDPAIDDSDAAARQIGTGFGRNFVTIGQDREPVGPVVKQSDPIMRLRAGPDEALMPAGDFEAVTIGTRDDGPAPAFGKTRNIRRNCRR
jgi:hypothetical protein